MTINLALFSLMPNLLHKSGSKAVIDQAASKITLIRFKQQESPIKKTVEKHPERPEAHPEHKIPKPLAAPSAPAKLTLPFTINAQLPGAPESLSLPVLPVPAQTINQDALLDIFSTGDLDSPLTVLSRIPPIYPLHAKRRGTEGWVRVRFIVHEDGHVDNVTVEESEPPEIFNDSVIRSVSGWRFKAGTIDGIAVKTWAETTIRFTLD